MSLDESSLLGVESSIVLSDKSEESSESKKSEFSVDDFVEETFLASASSAFNTPATPPKANFGTANLEGLLAIFSPRGVSREPMIELLKRF